jgi:pilus assembly protein CpaF
VDVIVHQERLFDGSRKVTNIAEVQGMEGDVIILQDIFRFEQTGMARGKVQGQLRSTGVRPKFEVKLARNGVKMPDSLFASGTTDRFGRGEGRGLGQAARGGH